MFQAPHLVKAGIAWAPPGERHRRLVTLPMLLRWCGGLPVLAAVANFAAVASDFHASQILGGIVGCTLGDQQPNI